MSPGRSKEYRRPRILFSSLAAPVQAGKGGSRYRVRRARAISYNELLDGAELAMASAPIAPSHQLPAAQLGRWCLF